MRIYMSSEEQAKQIEELYNEAVAKIAELEKERQKIISNYIKELETKKIDAIRTSMGLPSNS